MADVHSKAVRSYNMSQIKGKNTKPEMILRKALFSRGLRYRLHAKDLPGKPDIVFPKYKVVIFVNGCFWHGHQGCPKFILPKTRTEWWKDKIDANALRDVKKKSLLEQAGWTVITVFECELRKQLLPSVVDSIIIKLQNIRL